MPNRTKSLAALRNQQSRIDPIEEGAFSPDVTFAPKALRHIQPWRLLCAFVHYAGTQRGLLRGSDRANILAHVHGSDSGDWSFIRDAPSGALEYAYLELCALIRTRGWSRTVARSISRDGALAHEMGS